MRSKKIVAEYEKASGNMRSTSRSRRSRRSAMKIVAAIQSGIVPDVINNNPGELTGLYAWEDKLVDVTDVVATQREEFTEAALLNVNCYNSVEKKRSIYGVPLTSDVLPNHIWRPLVEKAGYKMEDIPKTWDAYYDFFKEVQKKLRAQGVRNVYGLGFQLTTNGVDPNNVFNYFLIAYGGQDVVTKDGKLHLDDPKVKAAAIKALTYPTTAYKEGFVPPGAINWNDADDNNALHAKQIVMDLDGTISSEVAIIKKEEDYNDLVTTGLALSNDGKPVPRPSSGAFSPGLIPKGAKNVTVSMEFVIFLMQPKVLNEFLKTGLARRGAVDAVDRQGRPVVARSEGSAPRGIRQPGTSRADPAATVGLQPGLCAGAERACLADRLDRHHDRRADAGGLGREGVQADRGDLREISDHLGLGGLAPESEQAYLERARGANRKGDGDGHFDAAFGASQLSRLGCGRGLRAALYRQRRGDDRGGVVGPGLRPGRGYRLQKNSRRLREGQRQQDRVQHHSLCAGAAEDRRGDDQRHRAGYVHQQPDRNRCALYAWEGKLVDVSDVVATQREEFTESALANNYLYNSVEKKRSFYGVPFTTATLPNHIWRPLVEKAGYKMEDIPKTWDAFYDFFKEVQKKLRGQGERSVYGLGLNVTTNGNDPNNVFNYFLIAYGGEDIVTKDGKLHLDDPKVKAAAIKALTYPTTTYKDGFVPPSALNWNDADDNNAFHAKQIVMDLDGTISTEVAVLSQGKKDEYDEIVTMGLALSNEGKQVPGPGRQRLRPSSRRGRKTSRRRRISSSISSSRRSTTSC